MTKLNRILKQQGFGLLEVMIAVLILAIGMLSLGSLHSMIIKSSSAAKARSTAAMLAQEKLDDLQSFEQLPTGGNGVFGYNEIGNSVGGRECDGVTVTAYCPAGTPAGTLQIPAGAITVSNVQYNRSWTETPYYFCSTTAAPSTTNSCSAPNPNFKLITMTVTWNEPGTGTGCTNNTCPHTLTTQSVVAAISPASTGQSSITGGRTGPTVPYVPGAAPDIIPINLGDNTKKEATKPTPDITQHGTSTITTFDEITYNTVNNTKRRDNFFTVNCVCTQNGTPGTNDPKGYLPTTFNGTAYVVPSSTSASKRTGSTYRQGQSAEQPPICDICCRDHHDLAEPSSDNENASYDAATSCTDNPEQFKCAYDPFRPRLIDPAGADNAANRSYHSSGDHKHYYVNNSGTVIDANNVNDQYFEACKMVLVGGSPWVAQDWKLETHQIMPASWLTANVSSYTNYATTFIAEFLKDNGTSSTSTDYPRTTPTASHGTYNPDINATVRTALSPVPTSATMTIGDTSQYVGRGIYMDYMSPTLRKSIRCKIDPSLESGCPNSTAETYLQLVPFHEVNLTKLATWTPTEDSIAKVRSDVISQGNELTYNRGLVTAVGQGDRNIVASIARSNTGLTNSHYLDPDDINALPDQIAVTVTGVSPPPPTGYPLGGSLGIGSGVAGINETSVSVAGSYDASTQIGSQCNKVYVSGSGANIDYNYSCTIYGGTGTIRFSGYQKSNTSYCVQATGMPAGTTRTISGSGAAEATTFTVSGFSSNSYANNVNILIKSSGCTFP